MKRRRTASIEQTPLDWAVEALMAVTLVFAPLAYGTTQPWSQEIYFVLVAAMLLCSLARTLVYRDPIVWTWAYVPIVLFILLVLAQRVPLPREVLGAVSPRTLSLRDELLVGVTAPARIPLTFYPLTTERQLRLVLTVAAVFAIVVQTYRTPERRRRLLMTVAAAGMAVAGLAAYQHLTGADTIYGIVPIQYKRTGPFINYSHFSQFMNLSIGATLAWLLRSAARWSDGWRDVEELREQVRKPEHAFVWPAVAMIIGAPLLVFASTSRMGMISMLIAGAVTAGLLGWRGRQFGGRTDGKSEAERHRRSARRRGRALFFVVSFSLAVIALLSAFGLDQVYERLGTLGAERAVPIDARQKILRDLVPLWKQFPLLGTGLGTHEFVFPLFNRQTLTSIATHAENEYAQLMEETGLAGVVLAMAFLAVAATAFVRVIRSPERSEQYAGFGLGFGLIAVLIHSTSDFGQHVPAVATLTAITAGLLICLSAAEPAGPGRRVGWLPLAVRSGATIGLAAAFSWVIVTTDTERRAYESFEVAQVTGEKLVKGQPTPENFERVVTAAAAARDTLPGDVGFAYWSGVTRWQKLSHEATDPATSQLVITPERLNEVRQLVGDLDRARLLCPTFGPPLGLAGQLRAYVLGDPAGQEQIRTAFRLTPHDRELCRLAGMLAVQEKRWDEAMEILGRYVRLGGEAARAVDAFLLANRPDLAQAIAAGDWRNLKRLADGLAAGWPKEQARAAECYAESERLIVAESDAAAARPDAWIARARLEEKHGRLTEAIVWYQKAVDRDYSRTDWQMLLAKSLSAAGREDAAVRVLRVCLRQRPKWKEAEDLLSDLLNQHRKG